MKKLSSLVVGLTAICASSYGFAMPYIGANLGYTNAQFNNKTGETNRTISDGGFDAGVLGGYEYKFDSFYLAGELNYTGYNVEASDKNYSLGSLKYYLNSSYGLDVIPGFYIDKNVKLFVMGGWQGGNFQFKNQYDGNDYSKNRTLGAWDLGLGTDLVLNDSFTLRLAYKYTDFNTSHVSTDTWDEKISPTTNQFNLSILYRFNF